MTIEFIPAICPNCGGELRVPDNCKTIKCMYCGYDIILQENNKSIQESIDNLLKLAEILKDANSEEAYGYYKKILELEPNNPKAWYGKGHCAGAISTAQNPRYFEMVTCFQKFLEFSPDINKKENIEMICMELLNFAVDYYGMATRIFNSSFKEYQEIKLLTDQVDFVLLMFKAVLSQFPTFSEQEQTKDLAIQICNDVSNWSFIPREYKNTLKKVMIEFKE